MKKLIFCVVVLALCSGCTSRTPFGKCIGVLDKEDPKLDYEIKKTNVAVGILFAATVVIPAIVILTQTKCPEGRILQ